MLYVLYGTDEEKSRVKLRKLTESLSQKKPDASFTYIDDETFSDTLLDSLISSQGLFESKQVAVFSGILKDKNFKESFLSRRKEIGVSPNIFFLLEGGLDKATISKLEKVAEKVELSGESLRSAKKEKEFNIFEFADALGMRDRKKLWVLYQKAKKLNIVDEEIHGILFWQAKSMLLAEKSKDSGEAGLNPFVYKKAVSFIKNYSKEELAHLSDVLISMSHDARRGKHDFSVEMERFVLNV